MGLGESTKVSISLSNLTRHSQSYFEWTLFKLCERVRVFILGNRKGQIWMETSFFWMKKLNGQLKLSWKKNIYTWFFSGKIIIKLKIIWHNNEALKNVIVFQPIYISKIWIQLPYLNFVSLWFTWMVQCSWKNNFWKLRYLLVFKIIIFLKFYKEFRSSLFFIFFIFNWNLV